MADTQTDPKKPFSKSTEFWIALVLLTLTNVLGALGTFLPENAVIQGISVVVLALTNTAAAIGIALVRQGTKKEMIRSQSMVTIHGTKEQSTGPRATASADQQGASPGIGHSSSGS